MREPYLEVNNKESEEGEEYYEAELTLSDGTILVWSEWRHALNDLDAFEDLVYLLLNVRQGVKVTRE